VVHEMYMFWSMKSRRKNNVFLLVTSLS